MCHYQLSNENVFYWSSNQLRRLTDYPVIYL